MAEDHKVALISGAARGIGRAIAVRLVHDGFVSIVLDVDRAAGEETVGKIGGPGRALFLHGDAGREEDVAEAFGDVEQRFGRLDALINMPGS